MLNINRRGNTNEVAKSKPLLTSRVINSLPVVRSLWGFGLGVYDTAKNSSDLIRASLEFAEETADPYVQKYKSIDNFASNQVDKLNTLYEAGSDSVKSFVPSTSTVLHTAAYPIGYAYGLALGSMNALESGVQGTRLEGAIEKVYDLADSVVDGMLPPQETEEEDDSESVLRRKNPIRRIGKRTSLQSIRSIPANTLSYAAQLTKRYTRSAAIKTVDYSTVFLWNRATSSYHNMERIVNLMMRLQFTRNLLARPLPIFYELTDRYELAARVRHEGADFALNAMTTMLSQLDFVHSLVEGELPRTSELIEQISMSIYNFQSRMEASRNKKRSLPFEDDEEGRLVKREKHVDEPGKREEKAGAWHRPTLRSRKHNHAKHLTPAAIVEKMAPVAEKRTPVVYTLMPVEEDISEESVAEKVIWFEKQMPVVEEKLMPIVAEKLTAPVAEEKLELVPVAEKLELMPVTEKLEQVTVVEEEEKASEKPVDEPIKSIDDALHATPNNPFAALLMEPSLEMTTPAEHHHAHHHHHHEKVQEEAHEEEQKEAVDEEKLRLERAKREMQIWAQKEREEKEEKLRLEKEHKMRAELAAKEKAHKAAEEEKALKEQKLQKEMKRRTKEKERMEKQEQEKREKAENDRLEKEIAHLKAAQKYREEKEARDEELRLKKKRAEIERAVAEALAKREREEWKASAPERKADNNAIQLIEEVEKEKAEEAHAAAAAEEEKQADGQQEEHKKSKKSKKMQQMHMQKHTTELEVVYDQQGNRLTDMKAIQEGRKEMAVIGGTKVVDDHTNWSVHTASDEPWQTVSKKHVSHLSADTILNPPALEDAEHHTAAKENNLYYSLKGSNTAVSL